MFGHIQGGVVTFYGCPHFPLAGMAALSVVMMAIRYVIFMIDQRIEGRWVNKVREYAELLVVASQLNSVIVGLIEPQNMYIMYVELLIEMIKLLLCMVRGW